METELQETGPLETELLVTELRERELLETKLQIRKSINRTTYNLNMNLFLFSTEKFNKVPKKTHFYSNALMQSEGVRTSSYS